MALSDIDRDLLQRCLARKPRSWEDFVDRFYGLIVHVVNHSAQVRSIRLSAQDREDLIAEVMLAVVKNDFALLRRFRGRSSLATYLTVVARRVVVRKMLASVGATAGGATTGGATIADADALHTAPDPALPAEQRIANADEVRRLLTRLDGPEADAVRMYHLEGRSYGEISVATGMAENSVGPLLSRARQKLSQPTPPATPPAAPGMPHAADQPAG